MGKLYDPPIAEELGQTVKTETSAQPAAAAAVSLKTTSAAAVTAATKTSSGVVDVYLKQLDEFDKFALDKHPAQTKKERQQLMIGFIRLFQNILKLDQQKATTCLNYFLSNVGKNFKTYNNGELFTPIFTMTRKDIPYDCKTERFMDLVLFLIGLQGSFSTIGASAFINGRDMTYYFNAWGRTEKETIVNFVSSKVH